MDKSLPPILYCRREDCCGCTACYSICPQNAIYMEKDEDGFIYPYIDENRCIMCYMCLKVCPVKVTRDGARIYIYPG